MSCARISYYYKKRFADFEMRCLHTHSNQNFEIMYVMSGSCEVVTSERKIPLSAGSYIIIGNRCPHLLTAQSADILNIEFYIKNKGFNIEDIENQYPELSDVFAHSISVYRDEGRVYTALNELIDELQMYGDGIYSQLLFKKMLIELCRNKNQNRTGGISYINRAKEYIEIHLCEKITISNIAEHIGLNASYLQTLFKQHTGNTIIDYINELRIGKACFIMRNTDLPIVDIAIDCGFSSRQHFLYTFKKHMGKTAREYRKG